MTAYFRYTQRLRTWLHRSWVCLRGVSAFYVLYHHGVFFNVVYGPSMFPTFTGRGDIVIAVAFPHFKNQLEVGDVVICIKPTDPSECIIKRVIALENSEVTVYPSRSMAEMQRIKIPKGHMWLQGDNLTMSRDSREHGPVPVALIRGKVVYQLWPQFRPITRRIPASVFME